MTPVELSVLRDLVIRANIAKAEAREAAAVEWHRHDRLVRAYARHLRKRRRRVRKSARIGAHCVYCGKPCRPPAFACFLHSDLIALDPKFTA